VEGTEFSVVIAVAVVTAVVAAPGGGAAAAAAADAAAVAASAAAPGHAAVEPAAASRPAYLAPVVLMRHVECNLLIPSVWTHVQTRLVETSAEGLGQSMVET